MADKLKSDKIQRDKDKATDKEKKTMAAIAKTAKASRVTKEAAAAAKVDQEAKGQEEKGNPNQELKRKEEERKQVLQSEAAQDTKNKEEKEKSGMADKTQRSSKLYLSPRHPPVKRSSSSPGSVSSAETQEEGQMLKLIGPPKISKKLETDFEAAIGDIVQRKHTGLDTKKRIHQIMSTAITKWGGLLWQTQNLSRNR